MGVVTDSKKNHQKDRKKRQHTKGLRCWGLNIISRVSAPDSIGFSLMGFHAHRRLDVSTRERRPAQAFQSRTEQFRNGYASWVLEDFIN